MEFNGRIKDVSMDYGSGKMQITFLMDDKSGLTELQDLQDKELTVTAISGHTEEAFGRMLMRGC